MSTFDCLGSLKKTKMVSIVLCTSEKFDSFTTIYRRNFTDKVTNQSDVGLELMCSNQNLWPVSLPKQKKKDLRFQQKPFGKIAIKKNKSLDKTS